MKTYRWNKIITAASLMAAAAMLGACSSQTAAPAQTQAAPETENTSAAEAADTSAAETDAADTGEKPAEKLVQTKPLVVYLNDFDGVIVDMFKEATGYDVEVVSSNGAETMSRIAAEKGNPQWDVVWIDSMYDVYTLSQDGQLMTDWEPENAANLTGFSKNLVMESRSSWCWQVLPRRFC